MIGRSVTTWPIERRGHDCESHLQPPPRPQKLHRKQWAAAWQFAATRITHNPCGESVTHGVAVARKGARSAPGFGRLSERGCWRADPSPSKLFDPRVRDDLLEQGYLAGD